MYDRTISAAAEKEMKANATHRACAGETGGGG
jgi:hypothetical protein